MPTLLLHRFSFVFAVLSEINFLQPLKKVNFVLPKYCAIKLPFLAVRSALHLVLRFMFENHCFQRLFNRFQSRPCERKPIDLSLGGHVESRKNKKPSGFARQASARREFSASLAVQTQNFLFS